MYYLIEITYAHHKEYGLFNTEARLAEMMNKRPGWQFEVVQGMALLEQQPDSCEYEIIQLKLDDFSENKSTTES